MFFEDIYGNGEASITETFISHNNEEDTTINRHIISYVVKRKALEVHSEKPSKLIRKIILVNTFVFSGFRRMISQRKSLHKILNLFERIYKISGHGRHA